MKTNSQKIFPLNLSLIYCLVSVLIFNSMQTSAQSGLTSENSLRCQIGTTDLDLGNIDGRGLNSSADLYNLQLDPTSLLYINAPAIAPNRYWEQSGIVVPGVGGGWYSFINNHGGNNGISQKVVLNGTFIVNTIFNLDHSTILMGPDAKIIVRNGGLLSMVDTRIESCLESGVLWDGIYVESGGMINAITHSDVIQDAKNAIVLTNGSAYNLARLTLNKNRYGVVFNSVNTINSNNHSFGEVQITCVDALGNATTLLPPSTNPPTTPIRSIAGIILNMAIGIDLYDIMYTSNSLFKNLDYGIYSTTSSFDIKKARFEDIDNSNYPYITSSHLGVYDYIGTAIYIQGATSLTNNHAFIGDPSGLLDRCEFIGCKRGIYLSGRSELAIYNSDFSNNTFCSAEVKYNNKQQIIFQSNRLTNDIHGLRLLNCSKPSICNISNNVFSMSAGVPLTSTSITSFPNTAIYISNAGIKPGNLNVWNNQFVDYRIAAYQNGVSGFSYVGNTVTISRQEQDFLGMTHYGFWLDNSSFGSVTYNSILKGRSAPSQIGSLIGLNMKYLTNTVVENNALSKCGIPARFVDNCVGTQFRCNDLSDCSIGIKLDKVSLDPQGSPNSAAGNSWNSFLTRTRMFGSTINPFPIDYYFEGNLSSSNANSPDPFTPGLINPISNTPNDYCTIEQRKYDGNRLESIVNEYILYTQDSDLNKIKDEMSVFSEIMKDDSLRTVYSVWLNNHLSDYIGLYALLRMPESNRDSILPLLEQAPVLLGSRFLRARDLYCIAAANDAAGKDSIEYNVNELYSLANQNAWDETDAVFLARAVLEAEVNDIELGLRVAQAQVEDDENSCVSLHICKVSGGYLIDNAGAPVHVYAYNAEGKVVCSKSREKAISRAEIEQFLAKGAIFLEIIGNGCSKTIKLGE